MSGMLFFFWKSAKNRPAESEKQKKFPWNGLSYTLSAQIEGYYKLQSKHTHTHTQYKQCLVMGTNLYEGLTSLGLNPSTHLCSDIPLS
jgi:hypothetical protein